MCVGALAGAFSEPKIATPQIFYVSKIKNVCVHSPQGLFRAQNSAPVFIRHRILGMAGGWPGERPGGRPTPNPAADFPAGPQF